MKHEVVELAHELQDEYGYPWPVALGEALSRLSREQYLTSDKGDFVSMQQEEHEDE